MDGCLKALSSFTRKYKSLCCCLPSGDVDITTTSVSPRQLAALEAALPKNVQANKLLETERSDGFIPALHKLRLGLLIYDQHLDDAATPREFFDQLLGFIDRFLPFCPRDGAEHIGAITTQSLNARDGYEKASREVYFWCVSALPLLDSFIDALQHEHTADAQTLLLAVYENGATIMRTVALALATTEEQLTGAKANVMALSACLATGSCEASTGNDRRPVACLTASMSEPLLPLTKPAADSLTTLYGQPAASETEVQLSHLLQQLAGRMDSMLLGIVFGWKQLQQTRVVETLDDERRQPNLLKCLDESTTEAYKTLALALQAACSDFMRRHAHHRAGAVY